jgi:hypothetical protein
MPRLSSINTFSLTSFLSTKGGGVGEEINYQGATMLFVQTSAPTGWTKDTTYNDSALRVVSGSVSSGGSVNFSTALVNRTVSGTVSFTGTAGGTTLTTPTIASHTHPGSIGGRTGVNAVTGPGHPSRAYKLTAVIFPGAMPGQSNPTTAHDHTTSPTSTTSPVTYATLNLNVKYVDVILATKD